MIGTLNSYQIANLLRSEVVGRIGCSTKGKTYVVPIAYFFNGKDIYAHTKEGLKTEMMRQNPDVCFEVDRIENMANWQSVVVWGKYEELKGKKAEEALRGLVNRIHPISSSEVSVPRYGLERPHTPVNPQIKLVVFRIRVEKASGKYEKQ
jgi:uncharacterized protein